MKIVGETPFQVLANAVCISPSKEGYTLNYSADGITYTAWDEAVPAGENLTISGVARGTFFKLVGNNTEVTICW